MKYDSYGFSRLDSRYFREKREVAEVDGTTTQGSLYIRFTNIATGANEAIRKVTTSGSDVACTWAYGSWADRASLTYETDWNTPIEA